MNWVMCCGIWHRLRRNWVCHWTMWRKRISRNSPRVWNAIKFKARGIIASMDAKDYIIRQFRWARRQADSVLFDVSEEQFNWVPPGTVSPIRAIFLHMVTIEDAY